MIEKKEYKKIQHLGEGSFGTVYLVQDSKGRKYALKKIKMNAFIIDEAMNEIKVMEKLLHPNLIRVFDSTYDQDAQQLQIVMQYCEGGDLIHYYLNNNKSLKPNDILFIFRQIVKAFIGLNVKGIMHRDLKPENVLLKQQVNGLTIKIADFGCARNLTPEEISKIDNFSLDKGTPIYASPQQLENLPYSSKCDVWSAGCLLYFISFGIHPFRDSSVQKTLAKIKQLTQNKQIQIPKESDPTIKQILKLTLVYEDRERATWRELWLSRFFSPKVPDVPSFLQYLIDISNIANTIIKWFWKQRKTLNISTTKSESFAYFIVKFQSSCLAMAYDIIKLNPMYSYLFVNGAYKELKPNYKQLIAKVSDELESNNSYFQKIKANLSTKNVSSTIKQKQTGRKSCFIDLDQSIKATYKILQQVIPQFEKAPNLNVEYVWLVMARWVNFEVSYSYEKKPRVQNLLAQAGSPSKTILKEILVEISKYNYGVLQ